MRIILVSNRLPITVTKIGKRLKISPSNGGLPTGLASLINNFGLKGKKADIVWVGWPGDSTQLKGKFRAVNLSEEEVEDFYYGFSNKVIWPLFHDFHEHAIIDEKYWKAYLKVNQRFAEEVCKIYRPGDLVLVQDYHLMLLPNLLRTACVDPLIGFFLHIPFPSLETFNILPKLWREQLLEGVLGADLIGFHTDDYSLNFVRSVSKLGIEQKLQELRVGNRLVKIGTYPFGINFKSFAHPAKLTEVKKAESVLRKRFDGRKVILSVDRLDYTKGVLNRLKAYEALLKKDPKLHKRVCMYLILIPSRSRIGAYERMKYQIDEEIGRINGQFGDVDWAPISYQYKSVPLESLIAAYRFCDVALITPLRDGMNLVAKEYLAANKKGTLILSERAGAAKELQEAILVNPFSIDEMVVALEEALKMPLLKRQEKNMLMRHRLSKYDIHRWGRDFIRAVMETKSKQVMPKIVTADVRRTLLKEFQSAREKLIFLDYDGTLTPFKQEPHLAKPSARVSNILDKLSTPAATLFIVSGRDKDTLDKWFKNIPNLIAEHGAYIKEDGIWQNTVKVDSSWKKDILPVLKRFSDRLPGSFVEEKEFSLAWHYRKSSPEEAGFIARELIEYLGMCLTSTDVGVMFGNKVIEIKPNGINKGVVSTLIQDLNPTKFILAIGDDRTDEDLFSRLPKSAFTVKVGEGLSSSRFYVEGYKDVLNLLEELAEVVKTPHVEPLTIFPHSGFGIIH